MGRYGVSEAMKNKNLQKAAVNYGINKLTPIIQDTAGKTLDQLSTKVRPKIKYKTDRKDLDGGKIHGGARYVRKPTLTDKIAEGAAMFVNPTASWTGAFKLLGSQALKGVTDNVKHYKGRGIDIHKAIGKIPKPKAGWTPGSYKYMGPYNPLDKQLTYNPNTGEVLEWKVQPYNRVDEIAAYHDICYDMGKNKGDCDREMVKSLDAIPYGEMPKWGSTARFLINTKQKLGLGIGGLHPPYDPPAKRMRSKNMYRR